MIFKLYYKKLSNFGFNRKYYFIEANLDRLLLKYIIKFMQVMIETFHFQIIFFSLKKMKVIERLNLFIGEIPRKNNFD